MPELSMEKVRAVMSDANSQQEGGHFKFTLKIPPFEYCIDSGS